MSIFHKLRAFFGAADSNGTNDPIDMIACEDALRLVHDFLDGELESTSEGQVRKHFDMCKRCYPHLRLETVYRDAVRRAVAGESAPQELKDRVSALLAEAEAGS